VTAIVVLVLSACSVHAERPNVVLILADDQSCRDFGFLGNSLVHTPNLDDLARHSARYPNGYVSMSVCRPSLATFLTGLYPHQHGIHFNHPPPGLRIMRRTMSAEEYHSARATADYLIESVPTLPRLLAENGYKCLQTGKHWEGSYRTAGFTRGMTLGRPADRLGSITGTRTQDNGEWVAHGNGDAGLVIGRETMQPIFDFLDQVAGRQPFFVWYAPFLPHTPFDAPEEFYEPYRDRPISDHLLPYYAQITRFDETVGKLVKGLEQRALLENTLIVFASDNGFRPDPANPEKQNKRSKLSVFEDGLRTPILIRWDAMIAPGEHPQLVHTVDIVPTILSAVGLGRQVTPRMRGLDLMASARGDQQLKSRAISGAIYPNDAQVLGSPSQHVRGRWIRDGHFKLVIPGPAKPALALSLFDLRSDPREQRNLADQPEHAARITHMHRLLDQWWAGGDQQVTKRVP
jgi:uncharacterized sulfatase